MAKIAVELNLPPGVPQFRQFLSHEGRPVLLPGQTIDTVRRTAEGTQHAVGHGLQPCPVQMRQQCAFLFGAPDNMHSLAIRQAAKIIRIAGTNLGIFVTENRLGQVKQAAPILRLVSAPGRIAMGRDRVQAQ